MAELSAPSDPEQWPWPSFVAFESYRGVTSIEIHKGLAHVRVAPAARASTLKLAELFGALGAQGASACIIKLHGDTWHFSALSPFVPTVERVLSDLHVHPEIYRDCAVVSTYAADMRSIPGVMAQIIHALQSAGVEVLEVDDSYNSVFCVVRACQAETAKAAIAQKLQLPSEDDLRQAEELRLKRAAEAARRSSDKPVVVLKFGGTSVNSLELRRLAATRVINAHQSGELPVVVVSAMGRQGEPYATDTLIGLLAEIDEDIEPRSKDLIMACGEIISTVVLAHIIRTMSGLPTVPLTGGQAGIVTDHAFGRARILRIDPTHLLSCLESGQVPVVAGFQGVAEAAGYQAHGGITTLGRGGSDTTASALGAALQAREVRIYTDVPGVMTADPKIVGADQARVLESITQEEICEMAHQGAKVIHPRAVEVAMDYHTPLRVLATDKPGPGTRIVSEDEATVVPHHGVVGIAHSADVRPITIYIPDAEDKIRLEPEIYGLVAAADVSVHFVSANPNTIFFVVSSEVLDVTRAALEDQVLTVRRDDGSVGEYAIRRAEQSGEQPGEPKPILLHLGPTAVIVSAIGRGQREIPGVMARVAQSLEQAGIEIMQVAGSDYSISCLIDGRHRQAAVRLLHEAFGLRKQ